MVAAAHSYAGTKTINGATGDLRVPAKPGQQVRVEVINTDNGPIESWADTPFRVLAITVTQSMAQRRWLIVP